MNTKKLLSTIKNRGFFHIVVSDVINKSLQFISSVIIIRIIDKYTYGLYAYSMNILSLVSLFAGLGIFSGMLQFCSESQDEDMKSRYFRFSLKFGLVVNAFLSLAILVFGLVGALSIPDARGIVIGVSFVPLMNTFFNFFVIYLRCKLMNKQYALLNNVNTLLYVLGIALGGILAGVYGIVCGIYLSAVITILVSVKLSGIKKTTQFQKKLLTMPQKKEIVKYAATCCAATGLSQLLYLLDVFLIGVIISSPDTVATYKVATQIPSALVFVPYAIITFVYPYFAQNNTNFLWIKKKYTELKKYMFIVNFIVAIVMLVFAEGIISLLYGTNYSDAVLPFRILSVSFFISASFRIPSGNILAMLRKVKMNLAISIIAGGANIILDIWLIQVMGSVGAAITTLAVVAISSMIGTIYLTKYLKKQSNAQVSEKNNAV